MNISHKSKEGLRRHYTVLLDKEEFTSLLDHHAQEVAKDLSLPGFRKGKVPLNVVKQKYSESITNDSIKSAIMNSYHQIKDECNEVVLKDLKIDVLSMHKSDDNALELSMECEILPDYSYINLEELELKKYKFKPAKKDYELAMQEARNPYIESNKIEENSIVDLSILSNKLKSDSSISMEDLNIKNIKLVMNADDMIPFFATFSKEILGFEKGIHTISFKLPEDYCKKEYVGQEFEFDIEILKVLSRKGVEYTDDEILEQYKIANKEELQKSLDTTLSETANSYLQKINSSNLFKLLIGKINDEVPESIFENKIQEAKEAVLSKTKEGRFINLTENEIDKFAKKSALNHLKFDLFLSYIIDKENIQVPEEQVRYLTEYTFKGSNITDGHYRWVESQLLNEKAIKSIEDRIKTKEVEVNFHKAKDLYKAL